MLGQIQLNRWIVYHAAMHLVYEAEQHMSDHGVDAYAATVAEFCRLVRSGGVILFTQREDLWDERDCDDVLRRFEAQGRCRIDDISPPLPYLPGNDGLADIGAIVVQLRSGR